MNLYTKEATARSRCFSKSDFVEMVQFCKKKRQCQECFGFMQMAIMAQVANLECKLILNEQKLSYWLRARLTSRFKRGLSFGRTWQPIYISILKKKEDSDMTT